VLVNRVATPTIQEKPGIRELENDQELVLKIREKSGNLCSWKIVQLLTLTV